jgi:hypothetical protein
MAATIAVNSSITAGMEPVEDGLADGEVRAASDSNHPLSPAHERGSGKESLVDATYRQGWICGPSPRHLHPAA